MKIRFTLLFTVLLFASLGFKCGGGSDQPYSPDNKTSECDVSRGDARPMYCKQAVDIPWDAINQHIYVTPGGVTIRSVVDVPVEAQLAIEQGVQLSIDHSKAVWPTWGGYETLNYNQVVLVEPDHYSAPAPVGDDPGAGLINVWYTAQGGDQHKPNRQQVSSADTCYGCPGFFQPSISIPGLYLMAVVPHQANVDPAHPDQKPWSHLQFLRESVYNATEHVRECGNDMNVCLQFAIAGDVHPHWGDDIWGLPLPTVTPAMKRKVTLNRGVPCVKNNLMCKPSSNGPSPAGIGIPPEGRSAPTPNRMAK